MPDPDILQAMVNGAVRIVIIFIPWAPPPVRRWLLGGIGVYVGVSLLAAIVTAARAGLMTGLLPFAAIAGNVTITFALSYALYFGYRFVIRRFGRDRGGSA